MQEERKKHHCRDPISTRVAKGAVPCSPHSLPSCTLAWLPWGRAEWPDDLCPFPSLVPLLEHGYLSQCLPPLSSCTWTLPFVTGRKVVSGDLCVVNGIVSGQTNFTESSCRQTSPHIPGSIPKDSVNFENKVAETARTGLWDVYRKHSSDMKTPTWFCLVLGWGPRDLGCFGFIWWCWPTSHRIMITKLLETSV